MKKIILLTIIALLSIFSLIPNEKVFAGSKKDLSNGDLVNIRYRIVCQTKKGDVPYDGGQLVFAIKGFPFGLDWLGFLPNLTIKDLDLLPPFDVNREVKSINYTLDSSWANGQYYLRYYVKTDNPETRNVLTLNKTENPRGYTDPLLDDVYLFNAGSCPADFKPNTQPEENQKDNKKAPPNNKVPVKLIKFQASCSEAGTKKAAPDEKIQIKYGSASIPYINYIEGFTDSQGRGSFDLSVDSLKFQAKEMQSNNNSNSDIIFVLTSEKEGRLEAVAKLDKTGQITFTEAANSEISFNVGECSAGEKPADQPKDNQTLINEQCSGKFSNLKLNYSPDGSRTKCINVASKCLNIGENVDDCIKKGLSEGWTLELQQECYELGSRFVGHCSTYIEDCMAKGVDKEVCQKQGVDVSNDILKNCPDDNNEICRDALRECRLSGGEKNTCIKKGQEAAGIVPNPSQTSDDLAKFIEYLKSLFKDEAQLACEGKDPNWQVIYPDYKPTLVDRCIDNATDCYNSGILEAFKNKTSGDLPAKCTEQALKLNMSLTNPQGDDGKTIDNDLTTPDTGTPEAEPNDVAQPAQGGLKEDPAEGQPEDETPVDVPTKITPFIDGESGGLTVDVNSKGGTLDVGARLTATSVPEGVNWTTDDCVKDNVNLWMRKIDDKGQSQEVAISNERSDTGEKDEGLPAGKFQNCRSYKVRISGPGRYVLSASYDGGQEGRFNFKAVPIAGVSVTVVPAAALTPTTSTIEVKKTQVGLTLIPKTTAEGDVSVIPVITLKVARVTKDEQSDPEFYSNDQYPNGEPKEFSLAELGENLDHVEATVTYSGTAGLAPSENSVKVDYASEGKAPEAEKPYVWLTTDPNIPEIFPTTPRISLIAATNSVVEDPHFEITRDSETTSIVAPDEAQEGCKDGVGSCIYKYAINLPIPGHYSIDFKNGEVSDHKEFTLNTEEAGQPDATGIELLYKGNTYDFSSPVSLDLDPGENVFERVIRTRDGDVRQSFIIVVEEPQDVPGSNLAEPGQEQSTGEPGQEQPVQQPSDQQPAAEPDQLSWFCEGNSIMENRNGEIKPHTECQNGQVCKDLLNVTPGYPVDAVCEDVPPTTVEPAPADVPDQQPVDQPEPAGAEPQPDYREPPAPVCDYPGDEYGQCGYNTVKEDCQWNGSDEFAPNDVIKVLPLVEEVNGECVKYYVCENIGYQPACD